MADIRQTYVPVRRAEKIIAFGNEATGEVFADGGEGDGDDQVVERGVDSGPAGDDRSPDGTASRTGRL
ncbi:hypothetical protein ACIGMX_33240 [Streptomyces aquilus]|uniref:hypothetical protein n=1 Tax=Streptomyces aquilus TaxID=2548456 RepID=UPI0037D45216